MKYFKLTLAKVIVALSMLFVTVTTSVNAMEQYIAIRTLEMSNGTTIDASTVVSVLGVNEVSRQIAPSGKLVTFMQNGEIFTADADAFKPLKNDTNFGLTGFSYLPAGDHAQLCTTLYTRDSRYYLRPELKDIEGYIRVTRDGKPVQVSFSLPLHNLQTEPQRYTDLSSSEGQLCIKGLSYSTAYQIELLQGFRAKTCTDCKPKKLNATLSQWGATKAREPSLSISTGKTILPVEHSAFVPVTVVNLDSVDVDVFKVDLRSLTSASDLFSSVTGYSVSQLKSRYATEIGHYTVPVAAEKNTETRINIDLSKIIPNDGSGIYFAVLDAKELNLRGWDDRPTQWLIRSNVAVSTYHGVNSTDVLLSHFDTMKPLSGADIQIIAGNNRLLYEGTSDDAGRVNIPAELLNGEGEHAPRFLLANDNEQGTALLEFKSGGLPLAAARTGEVKAGNRDIYVTSDRELYRGGETIKYLLMARDIELNPLSNTEFKVELVSPAGKVISNQFVSTDRVGALASEIELSPSARLGEYTLRVSGLDNVILTDYTVKVEDFVPLTIDTQIKLPTAIEADIRTPLTLSSAYFSGGAASSMKAEIQMALRLSNKHEDKRWSEYVFGGSISSPAQYFDSIEDITLDTQGSYQGQVTVSRSTFGSSALYSLLTKGSTFDVGGRPNNASEVTPLDYLPVYLGVNPLFKGTLDEGQNPSFKLANINRAGDPLELGDVEYVLREVQYDYDWYYDKGWHFRKKRLPDMVITSGKATSDLLEIPAHMSWGRYELVATNGVGFETVVPFFVGWYGDTPITEPTELATSVNKTATGELSVKVKAPFAGTLRIMEASTDIETLKTFTIKKGENEVILPSSMHGEPGFHVLTTLVRPVVRGSEHLPQIAVGAAWVSELAADRRISTSLDIADKLRSDQPVTVKISIDRPVGKAQIYLVDDGIHAITRFKNKDPQSHFFGQRKLSIGFLSNFGQLIQQDDSLAATSVGGDESGGSANAVKSQFFKTVTEASPLLDVRDGQVEYTFNATEFEGRLRLVAIIMDDKGVGFSQANIQIQDPVSIDVSLPRFVGAGDRVSGKLGLRFNENVATVKLDQTIGENTVTTTVTRGDDSAPVQKTLVLNDIKSGITPVDLVLTYGGMSVSRDFTLVVREPSYPMTQLVSTKLTKPLLFGKSSDVDPLDLSNFGNINNARISWSLSPMPGASMNQVIDALNHYPYGCIEQTSSGTRGVIAVANLRGDSATIREKINHGVNRILAKQKANGAFGYWDRAGRIEAEYLPYATETLIQSLRYIEDSASLKEAISLALNYLDSQYFEDAWTALYSYGVLANAGYEVTGRARYAMDEQLVGALDDTKNLGDKLDLLSAGYWLARVINDDIRANRWANQIDALIDTFPNFSLSRWFTESSRWTDASSLFTDTTRFGYWHPRSGILLASMPNETLPNAVRVLKERMLGKLASSSWRSTQDNANLASLLSAQAADLASIEVKINGNQVQMGDPLNIRLAQSGFELEHSFDGDLYLNAEIVGRRATNTAIDNGFKVQKVWIDKDGHRFSDHTKPIIVKQGDIFTVAVFFEPTDNLGDGNLMLTDLLPSGFEIESGTGVTPSYVDKNGETQKLSSLQRLLPDWTESMDDRYTANFNGYWRKGRGAMVYYQVRATYPGEMTLPDAHVEFMYRPEINGRSSTGRGQITIK